MFGREKSSAEVLKEQHDKEKKFNPGRRDFLKKSAVVVGGLAVGKIIGSEGRKYIDLPCFELKICK